VFIPCFTTDFDAASLERASRQVQARARLEPIQERVIPIQRQQQQPQQQQQPDTTTSDIRRHFAMYRRRASNVEPALSSLSPSQKPSLVVGTDNLSGGGFSVSVGRHSRGISLSLRPQQQQQQQQQRSSPITDQQRPLVNIVIPTDNASLRQPSPRQPPSSNSIHDITSASGGDYRPPACIADDQPSRFTIYQPLLATGRTTSQQFYDLPRRRVLLSPSSSPSGLFDCLSDCYST